MGISGQKMFSLGLDQNSKRREMLMRSKIVFACLLAIAVALSPLFSSAVRCQEKQSQTKATQSRGGAPDENIKSKSAENDPKALREAPPEKGGDKSRGAVCYLLVDNYTHWKIQIFVDGEYVGMVSPWGQAKGSYIPSGNYKFYAAADFNDGSRLTWGPVNPYCDGLYTWRLDP